MSIFSARTASEVFAIWLDKLDSETRRRAKAINFGIIYGISAFGLAMRQLGIPQGEARDYIAAYFEKFPNIKAYMERTKTEAREDGFVHASGRRIHISGFTASNPAMRGFAERQQSLPIQGTAADIIKRAMIQLPPVFMAHQFLLLCYCKCDELIFEVPTDAP